MWPPMASDLCMAEALSSSLRSVLMTDLHIRLDLGHNIQYYLKISE